MVSKHICILGLGYIGLPTAAMLANRGYTVTGVDINQKAVDNIKKKRIDEKEPKLKDYVVKALDSGKFEVQTNPCPADIFILAVPTPLDKITKKADLSYVRKAAEAVAPYLKKGNLVILESTVPIGTLRNVVIPILEKSGLVGGKDFYAAHAPERVLPTKIIEELINNDRIIGGINRESSELAAEVYKSFVKGEICLTNDKTAEMVKLMENVFRDVNIGLANEFAKIAEESGVNIWEAIRLANKHPRINIHIPGPGVGGHCIPLDGWFIIENAPESELIRTARKVNDSMPSFVAKLANEMCGKNATITILGVSYKGDVSDARETPAKELISVLSKQGHKIKIYDPHVLDFDPKLSSSLEEAADGSDLLILVTDHKYFKNIEISKIEKLMKNKRLLDTRNFLDHGAWEAKGFIVKVLGKKTE